MTNKDKDQVLIPMVTTIEAALDYGFSMKDIRLWKIGEGVKFSVSMGKNLL